MTPKERALKMLNFAKNVFHSVPDTTLKTTSKKMEDLSTTARRIGFGYQMTRAQISARSGIDDRAWVLLRPFTDADEVFVYNPTPALGNVGFAIQFDHPELGNTRLFWGADDNFEDILSNKKMPIAMYSDSDEYRVLVSGRTVWVLHGTGALTLEAMDVVEKFEID